MATKIQILLDRGANPNPNPNYERCTPLITAVWHAHKDVVQLLLNAGAECNPADRWGRTPLQRAQQVGLEDIVNMINDALKKQRPRKQMAHNSILLKGLIL